MLIAMEGSSPTIFGNVGFLGGNNYRYFVWESYNLTKQSPRLYIEGPAAISWILSGINIRTMANEATALIRRSSGPIFLVGWSRGAAACVQVALDLKRSRFGRNIDALFLMDPVDQDGSTGDFLNVVPDNVTNCYHAEALIKEGLDKHLFPTCAKKWEPGVNYVSGKFNTTHGGIVKRGQDAGARNWMWDQMSRHGAV